MKIVLGISGKRGVGKSLLAKNMEQYGFVRLSLAEELKRRCMLDFGLTENQVYGSDKETPTGYKRTDGNPLTARDIMIRMGTFYRSVDKDFWLKQLDQQLSFNDKVVIDDIRFLNEIEYLKKWHNAKFVRLEREQSLNVYKAALDDLSENELDNFKDWDYLLLKNFNRESRDLEIFADYISDTIYNNV